VEWGHKATYYTKGDIGGARHFYKINECFDPNGKKTGHGCYMFSPRANDWFSITRIDYVENMPKINKELWQCDDPDCNNEGCHRCKNHPFSVWRHLKRLIKT